MHDDDIIALELRIIPPWKIVEQILDTNKKPHELRIKIEADWHLLSVCPKNINS